MGIIQSVFLLFFPSIQPWITSLPCTWSLTQQYLNSTIISKPRLPSLLTRHELYLSFVDLMASEKSFLEYGCSEWRKSSQVASNLYEDGVKLWSKHNLQDIEQQLSQAVDLEYFTVHLIDGTEACVKNPMFAERRAIW